MMMTWKTKQAVFSIATALLLGVLALACRTLIPASAAPTPIPSPSPTESVRILSTPMSDLPAAGICAAVEGEEVTVRVNVDIPDPRCVRVRPDQTLTVVNNRPEPIDVQIGPFTAHIDPGDQHHFNTPFGEYLAWGVHVLQSTPCCSGEIWLDPSLK
jgi:hypothetical protein